jgi:hypothetical protein
VSDQHFADASKWLEERWTGSRECPICATDNWIIGQIADIPIRMQRVPGAVIRERETYPVLPVMCGNCGYLHLFNVMVSGVQLLPEERERKG